MNRLKSFSFFTIYKTIPQNIFKNAVLTFCVELTQKCVQEPGPMPEVFELLLETLLQLDTCQIADLHNIPHVFSLLLCAELGFKIQGQYKNTTPRMVSKAIL